MIWRLCLKLYIPVCNFFAVTGAFRVHVLFRCDGIDDEWSKRRMLAYLSRIMSFSFLWSSVVVTVRNVGEISRNMRRQERNEGTVEETLAALSSKIQHNIIANRKRVHARGSDERRERGFKCPCRAVLYQPSLVNGSRKTLQSRRCLHSWDARRRVSQQMRETTGLPSLALTSLRRKRYLVYNHSFILFLFLETWTFSWPESSSRNSGDTIFFTTLWISFHKRCVE